MKNGAHETLEEHDSAVAKHVAGRYPWHEERDGWALDLTDDHARWYEPWWQVEAEKEGREYVPVTERRRVNETRRRINARLRRIMEEIREIVLSRLERARSEKAKRAAQQRVARGRMAKRKKPYAPARGRRVSPHGGMSK